MVIGNVKLEAVPVLELLDADEADEVVWLDALLRIVVLHRLDPFVLVLHVDLVPKTAWERLQTRKTPEMLMRITSTKLIFALHKGGRGNVGKTPVHG